MIVNKGIEEGEPCYDLDSGVIDSMFHVSILLLQSSNPIWILISF